MKRLEIDYSLGSMDVLVSLARYNFVSRIINDNSLSVLDYGCGSGYGSKALKEKFSKVTGFDTYHDDYKPKDFDVETDITKLKGNSFDVITCFEVIEHIDEAAQNELMSNLSGLLDKEGTLFISTVRKMDPPPTQNRQEHHVRELTFDEFYDLCARRFTNIYTFGQIDQVITTFNPDNQYHFVFVCTHKRAS